MLLILQIKGSLWIDQSKYKLSEYFIRIYIWILVRFLIGYQSFRCFRFINFFYVNRVIWNQMQTIFRHVFRIQKLWLNQLTSTNIISIKELAPVSYNSRWLCKTQIYNEDIQEKNEHVLNTKLISLFIMYILSQNYWNNTIKSVNNWRVQY